jgi:tRNA threonylcarbamoyladenosine biosynthesis protein TsaB
MRILAVDTCFGACSAAVLEDGAVRARQYCAMERGHAEALAPMVQRVMEGLDFAALDRLAVTIGPGTFTGQRIGLAFMRAMAVALSKPLAGITSLAAMAEEARAESGVELAAAVHDAKRGEVYLESLGGEAPIAAALMGFDQAEAALRARGIRVLAGTAAPRLAERLSAQALAITAPDATWVGRLAVDATPGLARPIYLRAPDAKPAIRPALPRDSETLAALHAACFAKPWDRASLEGMIAEPGMIALLVEATGFVLLRLAGEEAEILTLAVLPAARQRGIATALVSAGAKQATARGARTLFLEVAENNDAARALYARLGFAAAGRRRDYYGAGQDALLLKTGLPLGNRSHLH